MARRISERPSRQRLHDRISHFAARFKQQYRDAAPSKVSRKC